MHEQERPNHQISSPSAGAEGRQSPGPCPFCGVGCEFEVEGGGQAEDDGPDSLSITGDHLKWCPFAASYETGATNGLSFDLVTSGTEEVQQRIANWNRRAALAAPGAPQGGGADCPLCESEKSVSGGSCSQCGSDAEQFAHVLSLERAQWAKGFIPEAATPSQEEGRSVSFSSAKKPEIIQPQEEGPAGVDLEQAASIIESCGYDLIAAGLRRLRAQAPASPPRDLESQSVSLGDPIGQEADENLEDDRLARIIGDFEDERSISYDDIGKVCYALRFVRRQRAAQPPEDTPIEAANLELRRRLVVAEKGWAEALAARGPIEKAAREAVNARQILIQEARKHGRAYWKARRNVDGHPHPLIYKERRFACLRALSFLKAASLSGLPQEGAAGEGGVA